MKAGEEAKNPPQIWGVASQRIERYRKPNDKPSESDHFRSLEYSVVSPLFVGMRISVELILSLLAQGENWDSILEDYPDLETDDIQACLAYAHAVIANDSLDEIQVKRT